MQFIETQKLILEYRTQVMELEQTNRVLERQLESKFDQVGHRLSNLDRKVGLPSSSSEEEEGLFVSDSDRDGVSEYEEDEEYEEDGDGDDEYEYDEQWDKYDEENGAWGDRRRI